MKITNIALFTTLSLATLGCDNEIPLTAKEDKAISRICKKMNQHPESLAFLEQGLATKLTTKEDCQSKLQKTLISSAGSDVVQLEKRKVLLIEIQQTLSNISRDKANARYYTGGEPKTYETQIFSSYLK